MRSARNSWQARFWIALSLGVFLGCGTETPKPQTVYELSTELARARAVRERSEFVIGTSEREPALGAGWSYGEVDQGRGRSFRWGTRPRSEMEFTVLEVRDLTLRLDGLAAPGEKSPRSVAVEINGEDGGAFEVRAGLVEYVVPISRQLLRRGDNRLSLVYGDGGDGDGDGGGDSAAGANGGNDGRQTIAMSWYRARFDGLEEPTTEPTVDPRGRLFVPRGSQVDFYLKIPPQSSLAARRWRVLGEGSTKLAVHVAIDGEPERFLAVGGKEEAFEIDLTGAEGQAARLSLAAIPGGAGSSSGEATRRGAADEAPGILLEGPSIVSTATSREARASALATGSSSRPMARPNILIYLVDTLRADRLGAYGHDRDVSPNIDRFAAGATLFENARAQSSWTLPAVASIFTGLWPPAHGVVATEDKLSEEAVTLAEHLRSAGYATSAIVANGFPSPTWGLDQGFEDHVKLPPGHRESHRALEQTISWLESRDRSRPFFLYVHTLDPHNAYLPPAEYRLRFAADADEVFQVIRANPARTRWEPSERVISQLMALYDALIAQNDDSFGRTLDYLEQHDLLEDALIVFVADHGEEFFEHGSWTHGANLFRETLDVPLIIKLPRQTEGRRRGEVAQHVDLLPTLLDYLEIDSPPNLAGRSLLGALMGEQGGPPPQPVFSHTSKYGRETRSVIDGSWKLMDRREADRTLTWLIEWDRDPQELLEHKAENPIRAEVMRRLIESELESRRGLAAEAAVPDEDEQRDLRALGYIE